MAKPVATAASTALPPRLRISVPIRAAIFSCATTMPCSAATEWTASAAMGVYKPRRCSCAETKFQNERITRLAARIPHHLVLNDLIELSPSFPERPFEMNAGPCRQCYMALADVDKRPAGIRIRCSQVIDGGDGF